MKVNDDTIKGLVEGLRQFEVPIWQRQYTWGARQHDQLWEDVMEQYRHLSAFPENREVLAALKKRGVVTGILSNGDPEMLGVAVRSAGLEDLLDHVLSVDTVRKYKTHPAAYALGPQATGIDARQTLFVSCNAWDALAATWYGYRTCTIV